MLEIKEQENSPVEENNPPEVNKYHKRIDDLIEDAEIEAEIEAEKNIRSKTDIIITSGAVSAGKHDFVPSVVKKFNLSNFFKGVLIRPGKPILFAK